MGNGEASAVVQVGDKEDCTLDAGGGQQVKGHGEERAERGSGRWLLQAEP